MRLDAICIPRGIHFADGAGLEAINNRQLAADAILEGYLIFANAIGIEIRARVDNLDALGPSNVIHFAHCASCTRLNLNLRIRITKAVPKRVLVVADAFETDGFTRIGWLASRFTSTST